MTRPVLVLRPEPGNTRTVARLRAVGLTAVPLPLFEVVPLAWRPPDPALYQALLLTSANAVRHAGGGLKALAALPVVAVGAETARVAQAAGLVVALTGDGDAATAAAAARAAGFTRLLHLAGEDHVGTGAEVLAVYASVPRRADPPPVGAAVALLHSRRAAEAFAVISEVGQRARTALVAISAAALAGAGDGWEAACVAPAPTDAAMVAVALRLARD